jgi:zinc D-Ala-D-Ala carboxypeptidase
MPTQLSPHFTLEELSVTNTGIDNSPTAAQLAVLKTTAAKLEEVRTLLGNKPITVNSAFRNKAVNEAVGGVPNSAHALGYAVDFTCASFGTPYDICKKIAASSIKFDQLIHERRAWVHLSFDSTRNRRQLLTLPVSGSTYQDGILP